MAGDCSSAMIDLVLCDTVPVQDEEFEADIVQGFDVGWQVENKRLVEHWVQRTLLDVSFLLGHPLSVVHQVYLHVRIFTCKPPQENNIEIRDIIDKH